MTNAIETAIISLIQQHAKPEIDCAMLADQIFDRVIDNIDHDAIKERVIESLDFDAGDVAREMDAHSVACELPMDEVANEICLSSLADNIRMSDLAKHINVPDADSIKNAVMAEMSVISDQNHEISNLKATVSALTERIAELESWRRVHMTLSAKPQFQPSTPTEMIERAKNLLADALGMLSTPTV